VSRESWIRTLAPALLLGLAACNLAASADEPRVPFRVTTRKPDDRVAVHLLEDRATFTVTSPSGIGGATVTRNGDRWPAQVVLQHRLRGLEQLQVENGNVTLTVMVSSSEGHRTSLRLSETGKQEVWVDRSSPFWTEVRIVDAQGRPSGEIPPKEGAFEITLPQQIYSAKLPSLTMNWIDFFR
jgi:hypothetical protein